LSDLIRKRCGKDREVTGKGLAYASFGDQKDGNVSAGLKFSLVVIKILSFPIELLNWEM
jgi:hypothetical protein